MFLYQSDVETAANNNYATSLSSAENNSSSKSKKKEKTKNRCFQFLLISYNSKWKAIFDILVLLFVNISTLSFLYKLSFYPQQYKSEIITYANPFLEYLFIVYIILNFFQKYRDRKTGRIKSDLISIIWNYLSSWFIIDFISIIPFLYPLKDPKIYYYYCLLRLIRIFKLIQMLSLNNLENFFITLFLSNENHKYSHYSMLRKQVGFYYMIMVTILVTFLLSCLWYYICSKMEKIEAQSFIKEYELGRKKSFEVLIRCFYFLMAILSTAGFGDYVVQSISEQIASIFMMILGTLIFSLIISSMTNKEDDLAGLSNGELFQKALIEVNDFNRGKEKQIKKNLISKLDETSMYFCLNDKNFFAHKKRLLIKSLPYHLRKKIFDYLWKDFFNKFSMEFFFYGNNITKYFNFYFNICFHLQPYLFKKGEIIYEKKENIKVILFLIDGRVQIVKEKMNVVLTSDTKDVLGIYCAFFEIIPEFEFKAISKCTMIGIDKTIMLNELIKYPELRQKMKMQSLARYRKIHQKQQSNEEIEKNVRKKHSRTFSISFTIPRQSETFKVKKGIRKDIVNLDDNELNWIRMIHLEHLDLEDKIESQKISILGKIIE